MLHQLSLDKRSTLTWLWCLVILLKLCNVEVITMVFSKFVQFDFKWVFIVYSFIIHRKSSFEINVHFFGVCFYHLRKPRLGSLNSMTWVQFLVKKKSMVVQGVELPDITFNHQFILLDYLSKITPFTVCASGEYTDPGVDHKIEWLLFRLEPEIWRLVVQYPTHTCFIFCLKSLKFVGIKYIPKKMKQISLEQTIFE